MDGCRRNKVTLVLYKVQKCDLFIKVKTCHFCKYTVDIKVLDDKREMHKARLAILQFQNSFKDARVVSVFSFNLSKQVSTHPTVKYIPLNYPDATICAN